MIRMRRNLKRNKFGNKKTIIDNIKFDSLKEANRYGELQLLLRAGKIQSLKVHPAFDIEVNGILICRYVADFSYIDVSGVSVMVTEDVKSPATRTPTYRLKKKLMKAIWDIDVVEV